MIDVVQAWKTKLLSCVHNEENEQERLKVLRAIEEKERAELDMLSTTRTNSSEHCSRDSFLRLNSSFDFSTLKDHCEDDLASLDNARKVQTLQSATNTTSSHRSRSMTLDSLGTFDTMDSLDMEFLNVSSPNLLDKDAQPASHSLVGSTLRDDRLCEDSQIPSLTSVYLSFQESSLDNSTTLPCSSSHWSKANVGSYA